MNDLVATERTTEWAQILIRRHLRHAWLGLLLFILLGTTLEVLHGWKSAAYLGVGDETRRLMWTLAHAHGIGLSLVQVGFAATLGCALDAMQSQLTQASRLLDWATALIPLGFFLGGVTTYETDPSLGILLVPIGALLLIGGVGLVLAALFRH